MNLDTIELNGFAEIELDELLDKECFENFYTFKGPRANDLNHALVIALVNRIKELSNLNNGFVKKLSIVNEEGDLIRTLYFLDGDNSSHKFKIGEFILGASNVKYEQSDEPILNRWYFIPVSNQMLLSEVSARFISLKLKEFNDEFKNSEVETKQLSEYTQWLLENTDV